MLEGGTDLYIIAKGTLLQGTGIKSSECLSELKLVQSALGHSWCRTMPDIMSRVCRQFLSDKGSDI